MSKIDRFPDLDARSLEVLLSVLDAGSVSGAAAQLGLTQSAVSHTLERLRGQFSDPLFVRAGRGITPTRRALELEAPVRRILDELRGLLAPQNFVADGAHLRFTLAANDFQRDLLLPEVCRRVRSAVASLTLDIVPSGMPGPDMLSKGQVELLITPHPPDGVDIFQRRLLRDRQVCFFDPAERDGPRTRAEYLAARHITLRFAPGEQAGLDLHLDQLGVSRAIELTVSNFSAVPAFLRGTALVATLPSLLRLGLMADFEWCQAPVDTGRFAMYMAWHRRVHRDAAHRWFRDQIVAVAQDLSPPTSAAGAPPAIAMVVANRSRRTADAC